MPGFRIESIWYYCLLILDSEELLFGVLSDTIKTKTGARYKKHTDDEHAERMDVIGKIRMKDPLN